MAILSETIHSEAMFSETMFSETMQSPRGEQPEPNEEVVLLSATELDQILRLQQVIFAKVAGNEPHLHIIEALCLMAENLLPNSVASVMLLDPASGLLNVLSAPSVPQVGIDALQGLQPGKGGGSCGNAVLRNEPVFVQDTFSDPRWSDLRQIAYDFNLCSCWSMPVRREDASVIGSFALSSFEHRAPSAFHKRLLELGASTISIVLERHAQSCVLQQHHQRLALMGTALSQATDGVVITDAQQCIVETNQAFELITGFKQTEVLGQTPGFLAASAPAQALYAEVWQAVNRSGSWHGEVVNRRKDGAELIQWMSLSEIRDSAGQLQNYVAVFTDLTAMKAGEQRLVYALQHDQLTGLPNKSKLGLLLDARNTAASILLLNVDNFSYINMAYGLEFGDQFLCRVACRLEALADIATVFRINADEFALYFDHRVDLAAVAARIKHAFFSQPMPVDELGFNITFTIGGACATDGLLGKAVQALRHAKELGKNHFHLYSAQQDEPDQAKRRDYIRWNRLLHAALNEGRVMPYFQGIRDNRSGAIVKYEALVRLEDAGQVYTPYYFLNAARLSGLMPTIARLVIERGFAEIATKQCSLSVNITEEDLNQGYLESYLQEKTQQYGIAPQRVILEILEGVSASGKSNHISQLQALKRRGYRLAIDDFGIEYSNFERILELNVDYVKIDAKYIKNIVDDKISYEVTRAIVYFAKNAGIATIAEFVHNAQVQAVVEALGIDYSQGYLFSEPGKHAGE